MPDLRDSFRALRATPIVTAVAVLSLALGIGANTAIFSILNSLMLRTLPVRDPQQLVLVDAGQEGGWAWTNPIWEQIRDRAELFEGALAWSPTRFNLAEGGETEFVDGIWTSSSYFDVLGVPSVLGRTFVRDDDRRGGGPDGPVTVISYAFWQRRYGGAADVIGRSLTIERVPFTIVGVAARDFFGTEVGRRFDVAVPLGAEPLIRGKESALDRRSNWWLSIMLRLTPDQSVDAGTAALRGVQPQIRAATIPEHYRPQDRDAYLTEPFTLNPAARGSSPLRARYERPLLLIMVVVVLVLLIACANIANLLLARAAARRHEISVRLALGASRARLFRQLLVESLLLALAGAALGLLFARWGSRLLVHQLSTTTTNVFLDLGIDWRILAFTSAVAVATALLFGTAPALRASSVAPHESLKEQGRGTTTDRRFGLGNVLIVTQVALSLVLVVAAGLFMRTFSSLANLDPGFRREGVVVMQVNAQRLQLDPSSRAPLYARLLEGVSNEPGVASAALSVVTPVGGSRWNYLFEIPGKPDLAERDRVVDVNVVSAHFFRTLGTRLIAGRDFGEADRLTSPPTVIVNEAFAQKFFDGENPVGRTIVQPPLGTEPGRTLEIVGYVQNAVYRSLREPLKPTVYLPLAQRAEPPSSVSVTVRSAAGSPSLLIKPLAAAAGNVHSGLALTFRLLDEQVSASLTQERMLATLSGFFGALALLLAGLGLYGVTSYAVNRRRGEIGIRMALGAAPAGVIRLVLQRVALLVSLGLVTGVILLAGFVVLGDRVGAATVSALLFGVQLRDAATLLASVAVLALVGAAAGWIPARRAARLDPSEVLRS